MEESAPSLPPPTQIPLRRGPLLGGMIWLLVLAGICAGVSLNVLYLHGWQLGAVELPLLGIAAVAGLVLKRALVRLRPLEPITFLPDQVLLPRHAESMGQRALAYADIVAVHQAGAPLQRHYVVESRHRLHDLPRDLFVDADGPERLLLELRRRIQALPQGTSLLEATEESRAITRRALDGRPRATQLLLGLIAVLLGNTWLKGDLDAPLGLLRWGALAPTLVAEGQLFRLLTAPLLHAGPLHALIVMQALLHAGSLLERLLGWPRLVLLAGSTALAASLTTLVAHDMRLYTVGASGCAAGLLAAQLWLSWQLRPMMPLMVRRHGETCLLLGLVCILPAFLANVDPSAQISSMLVGLLLVALMLRGGQRPQVAGRGLQLLAGGMAGLYALGLGLGVQHAGSDLADADAVHLTEALVAQPQDQPLLLNEAAWAWAIGPNVSAAQLALARRAADRAVAVAPEEPAFRDTLATLAYRQGAFDTAIAEQRRALNAQPQDPTMVAQMARFLQARARAHGPALGGPVPADAWHLQLDRTAGAFILGSLPARSRPYDVYALLRRQGRPLALIQLQVGATAELPQRFLSSIRYTDSRDLVQLLYAQPSDTAVPPTAVNWRVQPVIEALLP